MQTSLYVVGKTNQKYLETGINEYSNRVNKYMPFNIHVIKEPKNKKNISVQEQKIIEGELILSSITSSDILVVLDEKGESFSSRAFAKEINKYMISGKKHLIFLVGGPYGFSKNVYQRANKKLSISDMTFSHQIIRLIFMEQLYRACTILRNEPYHND